MKLFDPTNWYWFVAADATKVFSSASGDYVPVADLAYVAWTADGTLPTNIDTEASLGGVLAPYLLRPIHPVVLDGYTGAQASLVAQHVAYKILFNLMKRVAVLEGKATPTAAQALAFAKALM